MKSLFLVIIILVSCISAASAHEHKGGFWHEIHWGETLSSIALEYGVSVKTLVHANCIENQDRIIACKKLWIPERKLIRARVYTVARGDTLLEIAVSHRADVWAIAYVNGIYNLNLIFPGQRIYIPIDKL
jgi:LysM repeat protein